MLVLYGYNDIEGSEILLTLQLTPFSAFQFTFLTVISIIIQFGLKPAAGS